MTRRGITVFVRRTGGTFHASTSMADGFDTSATLAAANHYGVPVAEIELTPNGEHVLIATVRHPERPRRRLLVAAGIVLLVAGAAALALQLLAGGAR